MEVLASLIADGVRAGGFRQVPAAIVMQIADAAHARLRDPEVLADLRMTHAEAIDGLIGVLQHGIAGPGAQAPLGDAAAGISWGPKGNS
jgi:hypothetical protein